MSVIMTQIAPQIAPQAASHSIPITIRDAQSTDYATFAALFGQLGVDDPVPSSGAFVKIAETTLFATSCGATSCGDVIGYLFYRSTPSEGFVCQLVVDRNWRGKGVGEHLMRHAIEVMRAAGCITWTLNVKQHNAPAQKLYRRLGLRPVRETVVLQMDWRDIARPQPGVSCERIYDITNDVNRDARLEPAFGLPQGRLDMLRKGGGIILKTMFKDEEPLGVVGFRPRYPSIVPFKARTTGCAVGMLQAMLPYREKMDDSIQDWRNANVRIVLEGQQNIVDGLVAHGATLHSRLDFMRGPLPAGAQA